MSSIASQHCKSRHLREFAYPLRVRNDPIQSDDHLNMYVNRYASSVGEYITVYSFSDVIKAGDKDKDGAMYKHEDVGKIEYRSAKIDRLYLDFDNKENPQKAIEEALLVVSAMSKHGIFAHCYFSGGKGIAMYFEFKCCDIANENKKEVIASLFDLIKSTVESDKNIKLTTPDPQVRGDISRVSRIPNTKHKSGCYCIPVTFGDMRKGLDHIKEKAKSPIECDLESIITKNISRNIKLPIIIKNIEKEVVQARETKIKLDKLKADYYKKANRHHSDTNGITDEMIQKARSVSLSSVIGSSSFVVCPLHNDSQPSLKIDHHKGLWHCFGCGKGGDVVTFVMEKNNMDFKTAIRTLAGVS